MSSDTTMCFEALRFVDEAVRSTAPEGMNYFVLGGVAGAAYEDPDTLFDHTGQTIHASPASDKPVVRETGTKRDIDILLDGVITPSQGEAIRNAVGKAVNDELEPSIFGIDHHRDHLSRLQRIQRGLSVFVSQRSVDEDGERYFSMHPVQQKVRPESYEPWTVRTPQLYEVSVLHPVAHLLAYDVRSIGGPRPKDRAKMVDSRRNVGFEFDIPSLTAEGGLFHEWQLFSDALSLARQGKLPVNHPAMQPSSNANDLALFRLKARAAGFIESKQGIVDVMLKDPVQKALGGFTGTK